jgi:hypothetical protein
MSFNKKIITKEKLIEALNSEISLERFFSADSIVFKDDLSHYAFGLFKEGFSKEEIFKKIL